MRRYVLLVAGFGCVLLGALGVILPVLPTTPFILLAAGCFAQSSPSMHRWLLNNRVFGPLIHHWQTQRAIPLAAKRLALVMLAVVGGCSLYMAPSPLLRGMIGLLLVVPVVILWRLKSVEEVVERR